MHRPTLLCVPTVLCASTTQMPTLLHGMRQDAAMWHVARIQAGHSSVTIGLGHISKAWGSRNPRFFIFIDSNAFYDK